MGRLLMQVVIVVCALVIFDVFLFFLISVGKEQISQDQQINSGQAFAPWPRSCPTFCKYVVV